MGKCDSFFFRFLYQTPSPVSYRQRPSSPVALLHRREQPPRSEQRHVLLVAVSDFAFR